MKQKIASFLNGFGIFIMILCVVVSLPFAVPRIFGIQLYEVKTTSMEPEYPSGSVVFVAKTEASKVEVGDVITYTLGSDTEWVMTHRVVEIDEENQNFITKGDANPVEDKEPISFQRVIGKTIFCINGIAPITKFINSVPGVITIAIIFAAVFLMWIVADRLKKSK